MIGSIEALKLLPAAVLGAFAGSALNTMTAIPTEPPVARPEPAPATARKLETPALEAETPARAAEVRVEKKAPVRKVEAPRVAARTTQSSVRSTWQGLPTRWMEEPAPPAEGRVEIIYGQPPTASRRTRPARQLGGTPYRPANWVPPSQRNGSVSRRRSRPAPRPTYLAQRAGRPAARPKPKPLKRSVFGRGLSGARGMHGYGASYRSGSYYPGRGVTYRTGGFGGPMPVACFRPGGGYGYRHGGRRRVGGSGFRARVRFR